MPLGNPDHPETTPPPKWLVGLVMIPILGVIVAGYVASASFATLLLDKPLLLIALSPINRYLLLTSQNTDFWSYFTVAGIRHLIPDPFFYLLGFWYGRSAVTALASAYPSLSKIVGEDGSGIENPSNLRLYLGLAFLAPNNWVSLLCGAGRLRFTQFAAINIAGTAGRILLCRWIGDRFSAQVEAVADWVNRYQRPVTIASVVFVIATIAWHSRKGDWELAALFRFGQKRT